MAATDLIVEYGTSYDALRLGTAGAVEQTWLELGGTSDAAGDQFVTVAVDIVNQAAAETADLVDTYIGEYVGAVTGDPATVTGLDLAEFTIDQLRGGTPAADVYRRPLIEMRRLMGAGADYEKALAQAGNRASSIAATDIGLAHQHAATAAMTGRPEIEGYRRTLTGKSCLLCMIASTQRYRNRELMPIHTRCDCRVAPIVDGTDYGRVINRDLYRELKQAGAIDKVSAGRAATRDTATARRAQAQAAKESATARREQLRLDISTETNRGRQARLELRVEKQTDRIKAADAELATLGTGPARHRTGVITGPPAPFDPQVPRTVAPVVRQHGELGPVLADERHTFTKISDAGTVTEARPVKVGDEPPPAPIVDRPPPPKPRPPRYTTDSPEVIRAAARRNVPPGVVAGELNDKAARRAAAAAESRAAARALTPTDPDVIRIADRNGVTPNEVLTARARVTDVRRVIADEAAKVQAEAFAKLDTWDSLKVKRPPRIGSTTGAGRAARGGEYDWLEQLDERERARLTRIWYDDAASSAPDVMALRISDAVGSDLTTDEAVDLWLTENRRMEAAGALRRGRLPSDRAYSGQIDVDTLLPNVAGDRYQVSRIVGVDDLEAAGHIAQIDRATMLGDAELYLGAAADARLGPAPFNMSFNAWEAEVRDLEFGLRNFPAEMTAADVDRLAELVPQYLDEPGTSYEELHARIITTAERAGRVIPAHVTAVWSYP